MIVNQKFRYGVACLVELSKNPTGFIDANDIARNQNIPHAYAQKILQCLTHGGLITSQRGTGYKLTRPLYTFTVWDVVKILMTSHECAEEGQTSSMQLEEKIVQALGNISLACLMTQYS